MRIRFEGLSVLKENVQVHVEIRYRQASWLKRISIPLKYLATDDLLDALNTYRVARHLPHVDDVAPPLPLEKWE